MSAAPAPPPQPELLPGVTDAVGRPAVTFVVPCYNYAHYLRECVTSILEQTCQDVEVLIMDDCSPDNTPEVAASIQDPRVVHVRHPQNLGAVENINAGIRRSRGRYVWVLSPDDKFARPDAIAHLVGLMDRHPTAGIGFSQAYRLRDGSGVTGMFETEVQDKLRVKVPGPDGGLIKGEDLFRHLALFNFMSAPTVLVRRDFYERRGLWRTDVRVAPDWHTWARVVMDYDSVYWPEPALYYRVHEDSEWHTYVRTQTERLKRECIKLRWVLHEETRSRGLHKLAEIALRSAVVDYQYRMHQGSLGNSPPGIPPEELEASLREHCPSPTQRDVISCEVFAYVGNQHCKASDYAQGKAWYGRALRYRPWHPKTRLLHSLLRTGSLGRALLRFFIRRWVGAGDAAA